MQIGIPSISLNVVVGLSSLATAQTPPTSTTIHCEERQRLYQATLPVQNHPFWALITNARSDYWVTSTDLTHFGNPGSVQGTVIALYNFQGDLLAQNERFDATHRYSVMVFGSAWDPTYAGSSTMFTIGENYYLGVAGAGSVFRNGFNCAMSADTGTFVGFAQPTPGAGTVLLRGAGALLRRRR